jgi:hypothetical protein
MIQGPMAQHQIDNMGNTNTFTSKQRLELATTYGNDSMVNITENTTTIPCRNFIDDDTIIPQIDAISDERIKQSTFNRMDVNKQLCRQAYDIFQENSRDECHENSSDGCYVNRYKRIYFHDKTMQALFVLENDNPNNPNNPNNRSMCIDIVAIHTKIND